MFFNLFMSNISGLLLVNKISFINSILSLSFGNFEVFYCIYYLIDLLEQKPFKKFL